MLASSCLASKGLLSYNDIQYPLCNNGINYINTCIHYHSNSIIYINEHMYNQKQARLLHQGLYSYQHPLFILFIYIYVCVCVCVCVFTFEVGFKLD